MYQMNSKIRTHKKRPVPQEGDAMKTASLTVPTHLSRSPAQGGLARYLPHVLIAALLFAVLFTASHSQGTTPAVNTSLTHLGPH